MIEAVDTVRLRQETDLLGGVRSGERHTDELIALTQLLLEESREIFSSSSIGTPNTNESPTIAIRVTPSFFARSCSTSRKPQEFLLTLR